MKRIPIVKPTATSTVLHRQTIRAGDEAGHIMVPDQSTTPTIECVMEGGAIRYIDVRCACGHVTRLRCDYGETDTDIAAN